MNENYSHPDKPKGCDEGIIKGMYLFKENNNKGKTKFNFRIWNNFERDYFCGRNIISKIII